MSTIIVASSEPRVGRSVIAAAIAYRLGREGKSVTLVRQLGDDSARGDAAAFGALEGIVSPGQALDADAITALDGDVIVEAPAGSVKDLVAATKARVVVVRLAASPAVDATKESIAATIVARVPASSVDAADRGDATVVLAEDRVLAAPSVADIAAALSASWLAGEGGRESIEGVMIGTVASDAASPYFGNRSRTCVITRYDKTDIQLAALQTDLGCLVITGGGEPSPYLIDRVRSSRDEIAVLRAPGSTVEAMVAIEPLYATSRFDGEAKLLRAVELLDAAGFPATLLR
jgi:BioD-like phosphotransacetylase family protein